MTSGQLEEIKRQRALAVSESAVSYNSAWKIRILGSLHNSYFVFFQKSIVVHLKEIKFIEERHAKQQAELAAKKQEILDNKLKPKGIKLLKPEES